MPDSPLTQRDVENLRITLDKLDRTVEAFRNEIASTYARKDVIEPQLQNIRGDVDSHSEIFTWTGRLIVGAVIIALLGLVLANGGGFR